MARVKIEARATQKNTIRMDRSFRCLFLPEILIESMLRQNPFGSYSKSKLKCNYFYLLFDLS